MQPGVRRTCGACSQCLGRGPVRTEARPDAGRRRHNTKLYSPCQTRSLSRSPPPLTPLPPSWYAIPWYAIPWYAGGAGRA
eukprot:5305201-Prymnesium_polylepis.1